MAPSRLLRATAHFRSAISGLPVGSGGTGGLEGGAVRLAVDRGRGLAVLTLDRPERRNALTAQMMLQLAGHVQTLKSWSQEGCRAGAPLPTTADSEGVFEELDGEAGARAVVLRGAGGHFCAGMDFGLARRLDTPERGLAMRDLMAVALDELRDLPLLSVACLEGAAFGGGAELATTCDWRVVAEGATLRFVQTNMGISPGWGGARRLVDIVGRRKALELLTTGKSLCVPISRCDNDHDDHHDYADTNRIGSTSSVTRRGGDGVEMLTMGLADRIVRLKRESPRGGVNLDAGEEGGRGAGGGDPLLDSALDLLRPVLGARSAMAVRAVKRSVVGRPQDYDGGDDKNDDDDDDKEEEEEGSVSLPRRKGQSDYEERGLEERAAFAAVWGAADNLRAIQEATAGGGDKKDERTSK